METVNETAARVPTSYWAIAVVGLLWNSFGAYLYLMARLDPDTALAAASPALRDYVANQPIWANVGYGLGIWGSFLGSIAMTLRSRHAVWLFAVSLLGVILSHLGQALAGVLDAPLAITIFVVVAFLWFYSRKSVEQGILR
ncbi:hypothetical protein B0I00_1846 [Novosphingobium kunmingense]|uniref:DoxX-like protein n=1 Tax=Novosphingobium kunmingense TaxID=1211806 RepID=A0A2N0HL51_9SPHN|nr:hypothetical protein [Novosphingobium kunmingense]PKB19608.1 hypothetical protein B0I00_1846 [Novosphingobium kunmingense]